MYEDIKNCKNWTREKREEFIEYICDGINYLSSQPDSISRKRLRRFEKAYKLYLKIISEDLK